MKLRYVLFTMVFGLAVVSCGDDEDPILVPECETSGMTYTNDIANIFNTSCATAASCHGAGSAVFELTDYATSSAAASFGRIVGAISHETGFSVMPPSGNKIAQCDIDKVTAWIADGAPE